ncbi:MAG: response regulator [Cyanobacteria bacterium P01_A01_bin.15]
MHEQFEVTSFLHKIVVSPRNGRVHIVGKDIEWCFDIIDGQVLFAAHSLQYLATLETILPDLGYEALLPFYWRLTELDLFRRQIDYFGLEALNWTSKVVGALVQYNTINLDQAEKILAKLTEDAAEALLGLEAATVSWFAFPEEHWYSKTDGLSLISLIDSLTERLQGWQPLCDRISSPHQRPYCDTPSDLYQSVPQGMLSREMLAALARLMQGSSIRQLALAVRQDELKLAQLLYPYIEHRMIKLWSPIQPLDRLPWLPNKLSAQSSAAVVASTPLLDRHDHSSITNGSVSNGRNFKDLAASMTTVAKSRSLIICIDDSQTMLEKIESYLDPEYFEFKAIIDPVKSVSKICDMQPDLVLMDVSMPTINGNSLCEILKRSYMFKDVPIIMISSNHGALNKAKADLSGATDFLGKPFSKKQLLKILENHLNVPVNQSG